MTTRNQQKIANEQAAKDAALMAELQAETPKPPKSATIADNFEAGADLISTAKRRYRLNEGTLIKLLELQMMWELNNRQQRQSQDMFDPRDLVTAEGGGEGEGEVIHPEPDLVITAAEDADETETPA